MDPGQAPSTPLAPFATSSLHTVASTNSDPIDQLDALLEIYLGRLDAYQRLRDQLSQNLSAGFLSLAQANRTSNRGSGRRYGEEGYDERMKARTRVKVFGDDEEEAGRARQENIGQHPETILKSEKMMLLVVKQDQPPNSGPGDNSKSFVPTETESQALDSDVVDATSISPPPKSVLRATASKVISTAASTEARPTSGSAISTNHPDSEPLTPKPQKSLNPLNWYGVLVPQSLRAAQTSFSSALENQVAQLLNVQAEMAELEVQIGQLRKSEELTDVASHETGEGATDASSVPSAGGPKTQTSQIDASPPDSQAVKKHDTCSGRSREYERKTLSSRPREAPPRSRVLKIDT